MPEKTKTNIKEINELTIDTDNAEFVITLPKKEEILTNLDKKEGNED